MLRIVTGLLLLLFAAGLAIEGCGPATVSPSTPGGAQPSAPSTIAPPDGPAKTPSGTIEVPPPID